MTHFNDIELHRWRDAGPGADRERVIGHIAECSDCSARYASAIRSKPLTAEPATDVHEFQQAGYRVAQPRPRWLVPAIAAAIAIIALTIPLLMRNKASRPELHFRGGAIETYAPDGVVHQNPVEFSWASGVAAEGYRVDVGDQHGLVQTIPADQSPVRATIKPGVEHWWMVTALDDHGNAVATSARRSFIVRQ